MRKTIHISLFMLFLAVSASLFAYIYYLRSQQSITDVKVNIIRESENGFLDKENIKLDIKKKSNFDLKNVGTIKISQLEKMLAQNPYIEKSDVLVNIHSELLINIKEKTPVLRVFNKNYESFYIDDKATLFPLSPDYSPIITIANGNIDCSYLDSALTPDKKKPIQIELCELAKLFRENQFINAQITQIYVTEKGEYEFIPLLGDHLILFGKMDNASEKIKNLEVFYKTILVKKGWDTYASINLQFKNQVVCIK